MMPEVNGPQAAEIIGKSLVTIHRKVDDGVLPARREGTREGRWVLLDYVDVVVHIQHTDERAFYALDRLWRDCPTVEVDPGVEPDPGAEPEVSS